ncbi:MAG: hypothetical protein RIT45_1538 [Pseudomonadota bacterium]|jgi:hypothetical protein
MQMVDKLAVGRSYVLFTRDGHVRGRLARKDALMLELQDDRGAVTRIGRAEVFAVLEPSAPVAARPDLRAVS